MIVYGQISCICLHANEGRESKTKDSVYNAQRIRCIMHISIFGAFSAGKKGALYTGKYGNFARTAKTILTTALFPETRELHELLDK